MHKCAKKSCRIVWPIFLHPCKPSRWSEQTLRRPETLCKTNMEMSLAAPNGIWTSSQSLQRWKSWHVFPCESGSQGGCKYTSEHFTIFLARDHSQTCTLTGLILWRTIGDIHWTPSSMELQQDIPVKTPLSRCYTRITCVFIQIWEPQHEPSCRGPRATNTHAWEPPSSRGHHDWSLLLASSCSFETNQWPNKRNKG